MSEIRDFYDSHTQYEWERLERHPLEFALNLRMLEEHLPKPPCAVLDVGGGPGRYAIALAQRGYAVTLLDLSANSLVFARSRAAEVGVSLVDTIHGNALDLSGLPEGGFKALLLMGPLYHLLTAAERARALREAQRVLEPGGILAVALINRYASVRSRSVEWTLGNLAQIRAELQTGVRHADGHFTDAFSVHPTDVRPLLAANGFDFVDMIGSEGIQSDKDEAMKQLSEQDRAAWIDLNYPIAKDPAVEGAAIHLLAIARRNNSN